MKLMQWMQILRRQSGAIEPGRPPPPPVAARRTDAAAILRLVLNTLGELGPDRRVRDLTDPRPEDLLEQVEGSGYDLGLPHVQHTAGQMRVLLSAVRAGQVTIDRSTADSMRIALRYLGHHLMKGKRFPRQPEPLMQWNRRFQAVMASATPVVSHMPSSSNEPIPVMALPQEHPALVMPANLDPDSAIDAAVAAARAMPTPPAEQRSARIQAQHAEAEPPAVTPAPRPPMKEPVRLPSKRRVRTATSQTALPQDTFHVPPTVRSESADIEFDADELERLIRTRRSGEASL